MLRGYYTTKPHPQIIFYGTKINEYSCAAKTKDMGTVLGLAVLGRSPIPRALSRQ